MPTTAPRSDPARVSPVATAGRAAISDVSGLASLGQTHAVRVGRQVFISGQLGLGEDGRLVGADDCYAQSVQCFRNVEAILRAAGGQLTDVVKLVCYLTDQANAKAYAEARGTFLDQLPATTAVVVQELLLPGALLELDVTAVLPDPDHTPES
ncbi:RidA family protein [Nocardioides marmoriginsengisoli]|uniref:RidA family protein n=1 Tax=Nocardioides marmoriginsengisoli TaxID=661483 RepID=A0A3N0CG73_9ACTN|nr:RidA family protein [Nocardioides marmoriginsengisoli]RNL62448.1 RidA family protein [Nocardioides marmoriginsengisoli]